MELIKTIGVIFLSAWIGDLTNSWAIGVGFFIGGLIIVSSAEEIPSTSRAGRTEKTSLWGIALCVLGIAWLVDEDE